MAGRESNAAVLTEIETMHTAFRNHIADDSKRFDNFDTQLGVMNKNLEEILDIMKAFTLGKSFIIGVGVFIGTLVAIVLGLKQIVSWLQ